MEIKRDLRWLLIVDQSENLNGAKIGSVNDAIENIIVYMDELSASPKYQLNLLVNALCYSHDADWLYENPVPLKEFIWGYRMGEEPRLDVACDKLREALLNPNFMGKPSESYCPIIIFIVGSKTDDKLLAPAINRLYNCPWFDHEGTKVFVITIGEDVDIPQLSKLIPSPYSGEILSVHNIESIQLLSCTRISRADFNIEESVYSPINFSSILKDIHDSMGAEVLWSRNAISILNDYHAFRQDKFCKAIYRALLEKNLVEKFCKTPSWEPQKKTIIDELHEEYRFDKQYVAHVISCINFACGNEFFYPG